MIYIITNIRRGDNQWTYGTIDAVEKEFAKRRLDYKEMPDFQSPPWFYNINIFNH